jgi:hypothetical protein
LGDTWGQCVPQDPTETRSRRAYWSAVICRGCGGRRGTWRPPRAGTFAVIGTAPLASQHTAPESMRMACSVVALACTEARGPCYLVSLTRPPHERGERAGGHLRLLSWRTDSLQPFRPAHRAERRAKVPIASLPELDRDGRSAKAVSRATYGVRPLIFLNSASLMGTCAGTQTTIAEQGKGCRRLSSSVVVGRPRTAHRRPQG